jgi:hypothetical protein
MATPTKSMTRANNSVADKLFRSMTTDPMAATMGIEALIGRRGWEGGVTGDTVNQSMAGRVPLLLPGSNFASAWLVAVWQQQTDAHQQPRGLKPGPHLITWLSDRGIIKRLMLLSPTDIVS